MTVPTEFESTPLDGAGLQWLELYEQARATMRTEVVDYDAAAPSRPLRWPQMVDLYEGMALVEPERDPQPTFSKRLKERLR